MPIVTAFSVVVAEQENWEFCGPGRILFGAGVIERLADCLNPGTVLLVGGKDPRHTRPVEAVLARSGAAWKRVSVPGEPTPKMIGDIREAARNTGCRQVVAVGGGAVLDAGKAVAALLANPGELSDYLEVIGAGRPLENPPVPFLAVPTTSGTGSEATRNAVITDPDKGVKVSLRSRLLLPRLALVDPLLTLSLPPRITADSGLDALTQLIEGFLSPKSTPLTAALARDGIARAGKYLIRAFRDGRELEARRQMSLAALFSGMVLANSGLGAAHGFAGPLGGMLPVPHGAACARLLPEVLDANLAALRKRVPTSPALTRMKELTLLLTGKEGAPEAGCRFIRKLVEELEVRSLAEFGLTPTAIPEAVAKASRSSSIKGNPIELNSEELTEILARCLESP